MAAVAQFRTEHVAQTPRGWRVRSVKRGSHVVRIAVPPGKRKKGAGEVVEILHPRSEKNPSCIVSQKAKSNPGELLIFGNPTKLELQKAARDRAEAIRQARENVKKKKNPKRATPRKRRTDRNPDEMTQAVKLYRAFHGKDPKGIVAKQVSAAVRLEYTALGDLEYLKVITPVGEKATFNFEGDGVKLASSPDGKQLYCIGGNQDLSKCLDADSLDKDFIDLGEAIEVQYFARKIHGQFRPISYYHKFGEAKDGSTKPTLMYDKLRKQIFFVGGEYWIQNTNGVSPGIEN